MSDNTDNKNDVVIIKKYANRRLYDTLTSAYVTLDDLCEMVKKGIDFKVIDAKTEADITRTVLTQIIFEQESKGLNLLPISFLRNIISFYDDNLGAVLPSYLDGMMDNFTKNQDKMRDYMGGVGKTYSPFTSINEISKQNMEMFEQTMSMFNPFNVAGADKSDENDDK